MALPEKDEDTAMKACIKVCSIWHNSAVGPVLLPFWELCPLLLSRSRWMFHSAAAFRKGFC